MKTKEQLIDEICDFYTNEFLIIFSEDYLEALNEFKGFERLQMICYNINTLYNSAAKTQEHLELLPHKSFEDLATMLALFKQTKNGGMN